MIGVIGITTGGDAMTEAGGAKNATLRVAKGSRLWLEGDSTIHRYKAEATQFRATITVDKASGLVEPRDLVRASRIQGLVVDIPVGQLRSGNGDLDANMVKALKGSAHPTITFRLESYQVLPSNAADAAIPLRLHGRLRIAGVEKTIEVEARAVQTASGLRVVGGKQLLMSEYGVRPPALMLGMLRVKDTVQVEFDLELQPDGE